MTTDVVTVPASLPARDLIRDYFLGQSSRKHSCYPVLGREGQFVGMITESNLLDHWLVVGADGDRNSEGLGRSPIIAYDLMNPAPMVAYPDDSCREIAERFALSAERSLPVISPRIRSGCSEYLMFPICSRRDSGRARKKGSESNSSGDANAPIVSEKGTEP